MDPTHKIDKSFEWITTELKYANERIAAYSEADQKLMSVVGTVVAAIIGISFSAFGQSDKHPTSYALMFASGVFSMAVVQSTMYTSLTLLFMQRKIEINNRIAVLLEQEADFSYTDASLFREKYRLSFRWGSLSYLALKSATGIVILIATLLYHFVGSKEAQTDNTLFILGFIASSTLAVAAFVVTVLHGMEFFFFQNDVMDYKIEGSPRKVVYILKLIYRKLGGFKDIR